MSSRIDVSVEHKNTPPPSPEKRHPNTCPSCASHYRDDELDASFWVCAHCVEAYRAFRGRDPDVTALLKRRGFPTN